MTQDSPGHVRRRLLKTLAGIGGTGVLAGCLGDDAAGGSGDDQTGGSGDRPAGNDGGDSTAKVDELAERSLENKERADGAIESALDRAGDDDWEGCLGAVEGVPDRLDAARRDAREALDLATAGGHSDRAKALDVLLEIIDLLDQAETEVTALCEAGLEGNDGEVEQRYEALERLAEELERKEEELDRIMGQSDVSGKRPGSPG